MTEENRNDNPAWNYLPQERFEELSRNVSNALQTNPEALGQLADIIGDYHNLYEELNNRADTIREHEETIRNLNQSVLDMATRLSRPQPGGSVREERRNVADSEGRGQNGMFTGYPYGTANRGYTEYAQGQGFSTIGPENPGEFLIEDLIDEKGEWK